MSRILGVDNDKYRLESSEAEMERYEATKDLTDHLQREAIYEENRAAIIHKIRNSKKVLSKVVRGFFDHPIHIKIMFFVLTGVEELETNITNNLDKIVNQMEKYLLKVDKSKEGTSLEQIRELDSQVMTEFAGNKDIRRIKIIRWTADVIAKKGDGSTFFKMEDEEMVTSSPFMQVRILPNRLKFLLSKIFFKMYF